MKIVVNRCWGGFSISRQAAEYMAELGNKQAAAELAEWRKDNAAIKYFLKNGKWPKGTENGKWLEIDARYLKKAQFHGYGYVEGFNGGYPRDNAELVAAVEKLGAKANGSHAELEVVEIPDGVDWEIDEYDGIESIHEKHRSW